MQGTLYSPMSILILTICRAKSCCSGGRRRVDGNIRAYWGANIIDWGTDGTASRRYMGPLPVAGQWVRLEVPAEAVGLAGITVDGMAFTLYDGQATWDFGGKSQN